MMELRSVTPDSSDARFDVRWRRGAALVVVLLALAAGPARAQTTLSQTTWGGAGSDVADGVATESDGTSYVVGVSDSFAVDEFGTPSPRIFVLKFDPTGTLVWQRIWNGATIRNLGRARVAVGGGAIYVTGLSATNGNDAVLLKFDPNGTLLWERTWGGAASDEGFDVAAAADGSAYIVGTATSFGPSSSGLFVVKFDTSGNLVWQRIWDGAAGNAVAVGPDGSVYAAGTTPRPDQIGNFDVHVLKITFEGTLTWQRTYAAGEVVDPRGGLAVGADGSVFVTGAIQAAKSQFVDIAALMVKLSTNGDLLFDKQFRGRGGETSTGVAVAADDGSVYVTGTTTSFGAGNQDTFILHLQDTGKKVLDAFTWGGTGFEEGGGVCVTAGVVGFAATTTNPPPYVLASLAAKLSAARGTLGTSAGSLDGVAGVVSDPGAGAATPAGSTTFSGNFEAAFVRIAR